MEVLTYSKRQAFQNCPRYYLHRNISRLALRTQKPGRRRGTIFGQLIDDVSKASAENPLLLEQPGMLRQYCEQRAAEEYEALIESGNIDSEMVATLEVEEVKVGVMAELYIRHYGIDPRREIEFYLPLKNPMTGASSRAFKLGGKIDGIARIDKKDDNSMVATIVEDKFVGQIQRAMIMRLPLDAQSNEYVDAFLSKGWDAIVLYRHTKVPGINPTKEKIPPAFTPSGRPSKAKHVPEETLPEFRERLREEVEQNPDKYFDQQTLYFPKDHMDDYRAGRWGVAQQILAARRAYRKMARAVIPGEVPPGVAQHFPMNPSRCWEWGGCEYIPLCTRLEGALDLYVQQEDNPELSHGKEDTVVEGTYAGT